MTTETRPLGHRPAYGWRPDPERAGWLIPNPTEQEVIGRMVRMRRASMTLVKIAAHLEEVQAPNRGHKRWHARTVGRILKREGAL